MLVKHWNIRREKGRAGGVTDLRVTMRRGLGCGGVGVGGSGDASGGSAPSGGVGRRVLAAEGKPLGAEVEARDAVAHVLLQRVQEAHGRYA